MCGCRKAPFATRIAGARGRLQVIQRGLNAAKETSDADVEHPLYALGARGKDIPDIAVSECGPQHRGNRAEIVPNLGDSPPDAIRIGSIGLIRFRIDSLAAEPGNPVYEPPRVSADQRERVSLAAEATGRRVRNARAISEDNE